MDFERHCWAEIDLDALTHNFKLIQAHAAPAQVCAVVKAGAYGHGDGMVCRALEAAGAKWFGVSCLSEALHLRSVGIGGDILILGRTDPACAPSLVRYGLTQAVFSPEYARQLAAAAVETRHAVQVHLKVDTGMGRLGFMARDPADVAPCAAALSACFDLKGLSVTGLFQHFAVADSLAPPDVAYTRRQYELFLAVLAALEAQGRRVRVAHCCNSAALALHPEWGMDLVRPGILLYGQQPSEDAALPGLVPVLTLKAAVSQVKELSPGQALSYGLCFTASRPMRVATLCVGYADGYPRAMTNKGLCALHGAPAPVVGRVCMDQLMVDVTGIPGVQAGDEATVFGAGGTADTTSAVAAKVGTIPYEILCGLALRVPRVYLQGGRCAAVVDHLRQSSL
ncbi:alanine racemase [Allofournierella sp.]|uniref:alanine racemase n=1 Tax=Allofournierella sp. TaxID=1940256 RepID=UPI003AB6ACA4